MLYAIHKCKEKYGFRLYALCIMSNHIHYLIAPQQPEELPKIMHWLNWYSAMCLNRLLNRSGHFWEKRYYSSGFPESDARRVLNTIRYIHANPKAANMQRGFFYDFSNYGSYERLSQDGITQWHPAFMKLGLTLELCARAYQRFCQRYQPRAKPQKKYYWGSQLLARITLRRRPKKKQSPGQKSLWQEWDLPLANIQAVTDNFLQANALNPEIARCQVTN